MPTNDDFVRASEAVTYELNMMISMAIAIAEDRFPRTVPGDIPFHNAIVNAFLLAVRNIHEFFFGDAKKLHKDSMHVSHFLLPGQQFDQSAPKFEKGQHWDDCEKQTIPEQDVKFMTLIHTRLAHLSWNRISQGMIDWFVRKIILEFVAPARRFADLVPKERLSDDFMAAVKHLEDLERVWRSSHSDTARAACGKVPLKKGPAATASFSTSSLAIVRSKGPGMDVEPL